MTGSETEVDADEVLTLTLDEGYLPDIQPDFEVITLTPDETSIQDMRALEIGDNLIINYGDAGTEFHALAQVNDYTTLPSGATAWVFNDFNDYLGIPGGSAVDNLGDLTFHWQIYLNGVGGNNAGRLWSKQQQPGSFDVYIDDLENRIVIQRYTIYDVEEWKTPLDSIQRDIWLDIQLSWASGTTPSTTPEVDINNVPQEMEHTKEGTSLWADDTGYGAILGNTSQGNFNLNATVALFRLYKQKLSRGVRKSNYLADLWRWHDPSTGSLAVPSDASTPDPDPVLRIGKNVSSIDIQVDYSSVITKLYPRGSGSDPSELNLNWPWYFPSGQKLVLYTTDSKYAYFRVPGEYSAYRQYWGDGANLPVQFFVGRGLKTYPQNPISGGYPGVISTSGTAIAQVFFPTFDFRLYSVGFYLQRMISGSPPEWESPPTFTVGLYSCAGSSPGVVNQMPGYFVPYQGPLTWCYGNLLSISTTPQWYDFNLQANKYPGNTWCPFRRPCVFSRSKP